MAGDRENSRPERGRDELAHALRMMFARIVDDDPAYFYNDSAP
ncbi:hypothetical protein [Rhodococcus sp. IEGM 1379]|nr:hypothetical protein [Rhodococcus sp. IEGM 1379]MDI9918490.1 hypothetical protein [Rhodococcus sp. IEGM 1379]